MNLIYFAAFALILILIVQVFRYLMRRWTGYDVRPDMDSFYGILTRTDWAQRGFAEKQAQAEAEASRKSRKAKEKAYYEATSHDVDESDLLTDDDFSHLEAGYDGETEVIPLGELLEDQQRRSQS